MSFENSFRTKESPLSPRQPHEIIEELRTLQSEYLMLETDSDRATHEHRHRMLVAELEGIARDVLGQAENPMTPEADRDTLMGQYGSIMDQLAVHLPWSDLCTGKERDVQEEAIHTLRAYLEAHPEATDVARSLFMLFHHGAGIDKDLTAEVYARVLQKQSLPEAFAHEYLVAENNARLFLEKYIALMLKREVFSLDAGYQELRDIDHMSDAQFSYILDVANWYRRVAHYQKVAGVGEGREVNVQRAIKLHQKLIAKDPSLKRSLDMLYQEQEIAVPLE